MIPSSATLAFEAESRLSNGIETDPLADDFGTADRGRQWDA
jgi:hypothetical protein